MAMVGRYHLAGRSHRICSIDEWAVGTFAREVRGTAGESTAAGGSDYLGQLARRVRRRMVQAYTLRTAGLTSTMNGVLESAVRYPCFSPSVLQTKLLFCCEHHGSGLCWGWGYD